LTLSLSQFVYGPTWGLYGPVEMAEIVSAATGWQVDVAEILKVGARRLHMLRAFNAREGITRKDEMLPKKFLKPLQGKGPTAGVAWKEEKLEQLKDSDYQMAGWNVETGNPGPEKLKELELDLPVRADIDLSENSGVFPTHIRTDTLSGDSVCHLLCRG
jgi:aldehyde:ferredoxin oxidoreductase